MLWLLLGLTAVLAPFLFRIWKANADRGERSFRVLRSLPADIWVTSRARPWGRYHGFITSKTAKNPSDPFIAPESNRAYLDTAEAEFRQGVVH